MTNNEHDEPNSPAETNESAPDPVTVAKAEAEEAKNQLLYLRAEFDNYKKRILKEQDQAIKFANERFIRDTLPIVDLFERALHHANALRAKEDAEVRNFVSGIELTHRELIQLLNRFGVEFIGAVGEVFDPQKHEAISQKETTTEPADTVVDILQRGCSLNGRLISPAKVVVARPPRDSSLE